jgi:hypothetical protein
VTGAIERWLPCVMALLVATATRAEIRDLGRYGPTCPVPDAPPSRSGVRVRVEPGLARVRGPVEPPMPLASTRQTYILPGRWPTAAPPLVVFVGHDAVSLAVVRALPPGTPVFVLPSEGGIGLEAFRQACPACRTDIAGSAGARRLGIQALPAVVRVVDGVAHVTEGVP